jgi:3-hydroxyacyl-[acyl-carrier-protein] dehydratase
MQFSIATNHPALPGHFPGNPVVPGVVILDHILDAVAAVFPAHRINGIRKLKFQRPLLPDQMCDVQFGSVRDGRLRFECLQAGERIAEGSLLLEARDFLMAAP